LGQQKAHTVTELLLQQALSIREEQLGPTHPDTAANLNSLALLYQRILMIDKKVYGLDRHEVATDLNNLAVLYYEQVQYKQAESLYQRALAISETVLGFQHFNTFVVRRNYASLLQAMEREAEAVRLEVKGTTSQLRSCNYRI
jgi:tetratricopeptide (TPR) repeat protein